MRILVVCKRSPQQRDLIERPYGRFHHLPSLLACMGHEVRVSLISHKRLPRRTVTLSGVTWTGRDVLQPGPWRLLRELDTEARQFRPDWVMAFSDTYAGWIARRLARKTGARLAVDAYDDYESYMPWNLPLHWAWRRALRHADLVTAAGPQLADILRSHAGTNTRVEVLPMAADPGFVPMDKTACRAALGLPADIPVMGYIGSWARNRGTHLVLDAFRLARAKSPALRLVVSGHPPPAVRNEPGVLCVGYLADDKLPQLVNAMDVACIVTADTRFGRSSYPAKLCEAMACGVPVVATATRPVAWMLGGREAHLCPIGDAECFAGHTLSLIASSLCEYGSQPSWKTAAASLDRMLRTA